MNLSRYSAYLKIICHFQSRLVLRIVTQIKKKLCLSFWCNSFCVSLSLLLFEFFFSGFVYSYLFCLLFFLVPSNYQNLYQGQGLGLLLLCFTAVAWCIDLSAFPRMYANGKKVTTPLMQYTINCWFFYSFFFFSFVWLSVRPLIIRSFYYYCILSYKTKKIMIIIIGW